VECRFFVRRKKVSLICLQAEESLVQGLLI
jgi:hypothetical protein